MKTLSTLLTILLLLGCSSHDYIYKNYQNIEMKIYGRLWWLGAKYQPIQIAFLTDTTGCVMDYRNENDTIIQTFRYRKVEENWLLITNFNNEKNRQFAPLNNDSLIYVSKHLVYYEPGKEIFYFYRKMFSGKIFFD